MKAVIYHPDVRLRLYKTIKRTQIASGAPVSERFRETQQVIDLTSFLSQGAGSLSLTKSVREPAGAFSITFADAPNISSLGFETMYALIEPMDMIEIRMRHQEGVGEPPIVMRGFVSNIGRSETMTPDGRPSRSVQITGQDYGKIWQMLQILFLPGYVVGEDTLSSFRLFERFGVGFETSQSGADFLRQVIEKIVNPYLANLMPEGTSHPAEVLLDRISVTQGRTSLSGSQNQEGTIYNLLQTYLDVGIWNELFFEDDDEGVHCVYRPNPYKSVLGETIQPDAPTVPVVDLPISDVISLQLERSDADVANYYWVRGARFELATEVFRKQAAVLGGDRETVLLDQYENSSSRLYGIRVMFVDSQMGGNETTSFTSGLPREDQDQRDVEVADWLTDRRRILVEQNKDNVVLERGVMRVRGNEEIRAGSFVRLIRGGFEAEYYVVQVAHEFAAFQGFFTTLAVERGMGFVQRSQREGGADSPYLAEMRDL